MSNPSYLSQEWLDQQQQIAQEFAERPGATARIQYLVSGGPDGEIKYYWVVADGHLLESKLGEDEHAEVILRLTYDDSVKIQKAELDETAAFMQGRLKVDGDIAKLMSLMPLTQSADYRGLKAKITEKTDFGSE